MTRSQSSYLKLVAAGVVALALVVGLLLFLAQGEGADPGLSATPGGAIGVSRPGELGSTAEREAAASEDVRAADQGEPGSTGPDDEETRLRLSIVRARSGEPVSNATLRVWSPEAANDIAEVDFQVALENSELEKLLARDCESIAVDAEGHAWLAPSKSTRWAMAQTETEWGFAYIGPSGRKESELLVHPDFSLDVRVVDSARRPVAGMTVSARAMEWSDFVWDLHRARTNADGLARIEHVGWYCSLYELEANRPIRIALATPGPEPVDFEFEVQAPPRERVELVLPEGGSLEVRLLGPAGTVLNEDFVVELSPIRRNPTDPEDYESVGTPATTRGQAGTAVFRGVPLGCEFSAQVIVSGASTYHGGTGMGPNSRDEKALLEVKCDARTTLRGRVLDDDGQPATGRKLGVEAGDDGRGRVDVGTTTSDANGSFEVTGFVHANLEWLFFDEFTPGTGLRASGRVRLSGTPLAQALGKDPIDLGDIRLETLPLIASGRVVDENGTPVKGASVSGRVLRQDTDHPGNQRLEWEFLWSSRPSSDEFGRFELRSKERGESLAVYARSGKAWVGTDAIPLGSTGLELVLAPAGSVIGRIVAEPPLAPQSLSFQLTLSGTRNPEAPPKEDFFSATVGRDGLFAVRFVPAGTYDATVYPTNGGNALATLEGIEVRAGERALDPRLDPIAVRQRGVVLRFVDTKGRRVIDVAGTLSHQGLNPNEVEWWNSRYGELFLPESSLPADLSAGCEGYLTEQLRAVTKSRLVELRRAPRLSLEFKASGALPDADYHLRMIAPEVRAFQDDVWRPVDLGAAQEFPVPFEGRVRLVLVVQVPEHGWIDVEIEPASVQIDARVPVQPLRIQLDAERVRTAIEAARRGDAPDTGDENEPDEGEDGR